MEVMVLAGRTASIPGKDHIKFRAERTFLWIGSVCIVSTATGQVRILPKNFEALRAKEGKRVKSEKELL